MRVAFVLPAPVRVPMGGAAVVYRHAEGLAARGHDVEVIAPRGLGRGGWARAVAVAARDVVQGVARAPYYRAPGVVTREPPVRELGLSHDAVIATGIRTVELVKKQVGRRGWWFVQGDETFVDPDARSAWGLGLTHVACSGWLADAVRHEGGVVAGVVPNAVDRARFDLDEPVASRAPAVLALYHRHPVKGPETLVEVYHQIRRARPDASLTVFCARPPSHRFPEAVRVVVRPEPAALRALYNQAAVFVHTSTSEGWGLTPMEAAVCGCAVVATDSRGPSEYLTAGRSMRLHEVGDAEGLAASALELLAEPAARIQLAEAGRRDASAFSWPESTAQFERILLGGPGAA